MKKRKICIQFYMLILTAIMALCMTLAACKPYGDNKHLKELVNGYEIGMDYLQHEIYTNSYINAKSYTEVSRGAQRTEVPLLGDSDTKTYMDYRKITNTNSKQYQYIHNSGEIYVSEDGFLRTTDGLDYIGVALGSYFGDIGDRFIFTLDTGIELRVVKVEAKADIHTDENNYQHAIDGSIIEFVVDPDKMDYAIHQNGYIYSGNFNNNEWLKGNIIKIEKVDL